MANMFDTSNYSSSSSPDDPDDFSLFLHQIMLRSSSSSSSSSSLMAQKSNKMQSFSSYGPPGNQDSGFRSGPGRISAPAAASTGLHQGSFATSVPDVCFQENGVNVSTSSVSVGTVDNDLNDYDCESEGFEGVMDEALVRSNAPRNASKRSRAAEVHNLSEKRRRSRINEKMKALQNLIPNSNKTDKASMLDEAIEYLKQLQLQVQLLTVRNGLSLYPICLPGVLQSNQLPDTRMGYEGNRPSNMSSANALPLNLATTPTSILSNLPNNSIFNLSKSNDTEHTFAPETAMHTCQEPVEFPPPGYSEKGTYMEENLPHQHANQDLYRTRSIEDYMGAEATGSMTFNALASGLEENTLEACVLGRDQSGRSLVASVECKTNPLLQVHCSQTGRSPLIEDSIKTERGDF